MHKVRSLGASRAVVVCVEAHEYESACVLALVNVCIHKGKGLRMHIA